jgi:hypothetical protein
MAENLIFVNFLSAILVYRPYNIGRRIDEHKEERMWKEAGVAYSRHYHN